MWGRNFLIIMVSFLCVGDKSADCQETTVSVKLKILLQGCYSSLDGQMSINLRTENYLPLTSPYCEDLRSVTSIPADISDWILVQLRTSADGNAVVSKSVFLRRDGRIVADDGTTTITMNAIPGSYYVVIKHRNHLPVMTTSMIALSSDAATLYDFTIGENKCYGTSGVVEVETGIWAMWAGDINQDGMVTSRDYKIWYESNRAGLNGYRSSDLNFDGSINQLDYSIWLCSAKKGAITPFHRVGNDEVICCLSANLLDFGSVILSNTLDMTLRISNTGTSALQISAMSTTNSVFSIIGSTAFNIAVGDYQDVTVRFTPAALSIYNAALLINNNSAESVKNIPLYGTGVEVTSTVTDIDGNVYKTVKIGDQWWMAENLKVTHYRNGEYIPNPTGNLDWSRLTGAYCDYNNDINQVPVYGRLYNWYAVTDTRNLAPTGWHVPTDSEWQILIDYLGGDAVAGGKMKEVGTSHWFDPNTGATNESGFSAVPAGERNVNGLYGNMGIYALFWSSSEYSSTNAWYRILHYGNIEIYRNSPFKDYGFSVRCVKD
jgi:uncharacterized protein (TIGR02145 family)